MITMPKLNEESFKDIFESARYSFKTIYPGKIDMSYQDPAQTLLELFSLLVDMQRFYMEFIGEEHYKKYIRLLGLGQQKMEYFRALVDIKLLGTDKVYPSDYPVLLDGIHFETLKHTKTTDSDFDNTIELIQKKTFCKAEKYILTPAEPLVLSSYLALHENIELFIITENGCVEYSDYTTEKDFENGITTLKISGIDATAEFLVLYYTSDFKDSRIVILPPIPDKTVKPNIPNLDDDSVRLHIRRDGSDYWQEWTKVDDFDKSGSGDLHFKIENGVISFGNHENGEIPCGEIRLINCVSSLGSRGIIHNYVIKGEGGTDKPSYLDIVNAIPSELQKVHKAVTADDYRVILSKMTAVKIDRINVISNANCITIYVKPSNGSFLPVVNPDECKLIRAFLEPYRIITTKISIASVEYFAINISIEASFNPEWDNCEERTRKYVSELFTCSYFKNDVARPFGETIFYGEMSVIISSMPWIIQLKELKINGKSGNLTLKENELAYVDKITFVERCAHE